MTGADSPLMLRTLAGQPTPRPPVWAMRQAGRWDPEFNRLRGSLTFYEFSENPELAAKASLLPLRFGVDAVILFYDITTLAVAMGQPFRLVRDVGPVPEWPVRTLADLTRLDPRPDPARFQYVLDLLRIVRAEVGSEFPVLVFAGAPFTLASYCIGTGKDLATTRRFAAEHSEVWGSLLERLESATSHFLKTLAAAGATAYQLFDSWAGRLDAAEYLAWAQPFHERIFATVTDIPSILFVKEGRHLDAMATSGCRVLSLGATHDLAHVRAAYPNLILQGNVDQELLVHGSPEEVRLATRRCLDALGGVGHIVNLNHGLDRATPVANFQALVATVRDWSKGGQPP